MADRYCGTLDILKSDIERYPELKKAVQDEFYCNGKLCNEDNWDEDSPVASFIDPNAYYGHFPEVEETCRKLRVPYDGWSAAYIDDSLTRHYRPDVNKDDDDETYCNGDDEKTYSACFLKSLTEGTDTGNPAGLAAIGKRFLGFLDSIPEIRPLTEYEGYVHKA